MTEATKAVETEIVEAEIVEGPRHLTLVKAGPTSPVVPMSIEDSVTDRLLRDPNLPVEHVKEVLALRTQLYAQRRQERMDTAREEFFENLAKAQSEMRRVVTDRANEHTKSRYATYAQLDRVVRPIYTGHGFSVTFNTRPCDIPNHVIVTAKVTRGLHTEDYETPPLFSDNTGAQGKATAMNKTQAVGSAKTYGRRYLLIDIFNIAIANEADDDDGNAAGGNEPQQEGDDAKIGAEQIKFLTGLMEASKYDAQKLLKHFGVGKLGDLTFKQMRSAVGSLQARKSRQAQETNPGATK